MLVTVTGNRGIIRGSSTTLQNTTLFGRSDPSLTLTFYFIPPNAPFDLRQVCWPFPPICCVLICQLLVRMFIMYLSKPFVAALFPTVIFPFLHATVWKYTADLHDFSRSLASKLRPRLRHPIVSVSCFDLFCPWLCISETGTGSIIQFDFVFSVK